MLKEYLNFKGISVYSLAKMSGVAYSTLNDLVNGKVDINNCKVSLIRSLATALAVSLDDLYDICTEEKKVINNSYNAEASLHVRAKYYYARFNYKDESIDLKLCKVNEENTYYIEDIAKWRIEAYIRDRRMQEFR